MRLGRIAAILALGWGAMNSAAATADSNRASAPIAPKSGVIRLFNGRNLDGLYVYLKDTKYADPRRVFTVEKGLLHVSGDGLGTLCTKSEYKDYHLVVEFKWGAKTWGKRQSKARDSGCLIHCNGSDGGRRGTWPHSFEAQIIEGGTGDILLVDGEDDAGNPLPMSLTAEVTQNGGEIIWHKGGARKTFHTMKRIDWFGRDPDWKDVTGFRGRHDVESPLGAWTRMDVVASGDRVQVYVNGILVNEAFDLVPSSGKILLQTELAEIWFRRWELYPLGHAPPFEHK